jgi:hypothetical protein
MKGSKALAGAWCKCKNKHPRGESNKKTEILKAAKTKAEINKSNQKLGK